ncbi:MAG: hypothetical protein ACRYG8_54375 [Janthinobacterium lividum]
MTWGSSKDEIGSLVRTGTAVDLDRDVVATQAEISSSTYLVTRAWMDRIVSACRRYGTIFIVGKS